MSVSTDSEASTSYNFKSYIVPSYAPLLDSKPRYPSIFNLGKGSKDGSLRPESPRRVSVPHCCRPLSHPRSSLHYPLHKSIECTSRPAGRTIRQPFALFRSFVRFDEVLVDGGIDVVFNVRVVVGGHSDTVCGGSGSLRIFVEAAVWNICTATSTCPFFHKFKLANSGRRNLFLHRCRAVTFQVQLLATA